jgi:ornithine carbamoyltransferase
VLHLGGGGIFITSKEAGLHGRESLPDIARVLSSYSDAIALRTFSQKLIEDLAEHASCPIINALSDDRHPCQALTDLFTIQEVLGTLEDLHLFYLGDGNNVAKSLAIATAYMGMRMTLASPKGFELPADFMKLLQRRVPTARLTVTNQIDAGVSTADLIYTDVWASMGQESEADDRRSKFAPFQVNAQLMSKAPKDCRFMHDLPAHRGEEVTDEVLDGPNSIAFLQAENRMHLAKGLLVWLIKPGL